MRPVTDLLELAATPPTVDVAPEEYARLLGYPRGHVLEGRARELAEWARAWYAEHGRPWLYARQADSFALDSDTIPHRWRGRSPARACARRCKKPKPTTRSSSRPAPARNWKRKRAAAGKPKSPTTISSSKCTAPPSSSTSSRSPAPASATGPSSRAWPSCPTTAPATRTGILPSSRACWKFCSAPAARRSPPRSKRSTPACCAPANRCSPSSDSPGTPIASAASPISSPARTAPSAPALTAARLIVGPRRLSRSQRNGQPPAGLDPQAAYTVNRKALERWSKERLSLRPCADGSLEADLPLRRHHLHQHGPAARL